MPATGSLSSPVAVAASASRSSPESEATSDLPSSPESEAASGSPSSSEPLPDKGSLSSLESAATAGLPDSSLEDRPAGGDSSTGAPAEDLLEDSHESLEEAEGEPAGERAMGMEPLSPGAPLGEPGCAKRTTGRQHRC